MREAGHFTSTLQLLIAVVIIASILFTIFTQAAKPLDAEHLKLIVSDLRSSASEGKLLSEQSFQSSTRQRYLQSQRQFIQQHLQKQIQQLKTSDAKQNIHQQQALALTIATQLSDAFEQLPVAGKANGLEFKAVFDELLSLESQLRKMS
jgi:hypothetical protein